MKATIVPGGLHRGFQFQPLLLPRSLPTSGYGAPRPLYLANKQHFDGFHANNWWVSVLTGERFGFPSGCFHSHEALELHVIVLA